MDIPAIDSLLATVVGSAEMNREQVFTTVKDIFQHFASVSNQAGLNQFLGVGPNTLNVILNPQTIPPINPTNLDDAHATNFRVMDIGSALGYLFSKLPVPPNVSIESLRPRLVQYAALMSRISKMQGSENAMTNVICNPTTGALHFGSTIQKPRNNPGDLKMTAQKYRYDCLAAAIGPLPVLPPNVELIVVKLLKNDYLLPSNEAEHADYRQALKGWANHPRGQNNFEARKKPPWEHEDYLAWLYLQLSRSLLKSSNGTRPLVVVSVDSYKDAQGWSADIVNLLMTNKRPVTYREPQPIIPVEVERGPDDAAAGGSEPETDVDPGIVAVKRCLLELLNPATVFSYIEAALALETSLKLYGQCAETYPMMHCASTHTANQGLALRIKSAHSLPPNAPEAVIHKAFAYPCLNCRSLLHTMACPETDFDDYLLKTIKKARDKPIPLNEYFVGTKREWNPAV